MNVINLRSNSTAKGKVLVIYTGGTFGMVYDEASGVLQPYDFQNILQYFPEVKKLQLDISFVSLKKIIDSSNIELSNWQELAEIINKNYEIFDGFIIIHGTDTMAYSASALSFMFNNLNKPIIFTGAQLPVSEVRSDARDNFITALEIASSKQKNEASIKEVCIYFNNFLLRGNRAKKVESAHFDAFESPNYPPLAESGINIDYFRQNSLTPPDQPLHVQFGFDPNVAVLKLFPGMTELYVDGIVNCSNLKGLIIETFGSGNAPNSYWFTKKVKMAVEMGVVVYNVSQCYKGHVNQNRYETGRHLLDIGVVSGDNITTEAAITKMMHILAIETDLEKVKNYLANNIAGELG